jgi:hypothetical protein
MPSSSAFTLAALSFKERVQRDLPAVDVFQQLGIAAAEERLG